VDAPAETLRRGLSGPFHVGPGRTRVIQDFCVFHGREVNEPSTEKAARVLEVVRDSELCPDLAVVNLALSRRVFRSDIFFRAEQRREQMSRTAARQPVEEPIYN
jgi:hypothetical protein